MSLVGKYPEWITTNHVYLALLFTGDICVYMVVLYKEELHQFTFSDQILEAAVTHN